MWKASQKQYEKAPSGSFIARCYSVCEMGTQTHVSQQFGTRSKFDVRLSFELPTEKMEGKFDAAQKGKPFSVHLTVTRSLHKKSQLRAMLAGWRGRDFTDEELQNFDEKKLVGAPCRVNIVHNGEYANIASISPLGKGDKCPKQVNRSVYVSLDPNVFEPAMLENLGEFTQKKIMASPEYQALMGGDQQPDAPEEVEAETTTADDDVPF